MNKYVIAPDSFKGSMSSQTVCECIKNGILAVNPEAQVVSIPIADGGEGTVDAFVYAMGGEMLTAIASDPYMAKINTFYGIVNKHTAVIEMAAVAGLVLAGTQSNPENTTTYGVGELILHALSRGVSKIILGLGGSATNDGGCGMACALGVRFLDKNKKEFVPTGKTLIDIEKIDVSLLNPLVKNVDFQIMCDIDNPLYGEKGAAYVFAKQKGADDAMIKRLDEGLIHLNEIILRDIGIDTNKLKGAGAAGGMGAGSVAFLDGKLCSGIDTILNTVEFDKIIDDADIIFTGEGRIDSQSVDGKVISGIAKRAKQKNVPVVALVGGIDGDISEIYKQGITSVFSICRKPQTLQNAILNSKESLASVTSDIIRLCNR